MPWTTSDIQDQTGKKILITGSNTGIGFATAMILAGKGAEITLACRSPDKGEQAVARLKNEVPGANVNLVQLDLADLASVRQCAEAVNAQFDRLDVLINNAGLMMPPLQRTIDGFELQYGTNVLGTFALTGLLFPLLEKTPDSRVVWLSSVAHTRGKIDFENLNAEKGYNKFAAYAQSKLADLMLAYEMDRRLKRIGASMDSLAAHPGTTQSELSRNNLFLKITNRVISAFLQSAEDGAMPSVRAAVDPGARGGEYYGPDGFMHLRGAAIKHDSSDDSYNETIASRLWKSCEELTGIRWLD